MYSVYILFSTKDNKLYIGITENLSRRLKEHRYGKVESTESRRPLKLIHYETFIDKKDAERREKYLKGGNGRKNLKIMLKNHLTKLKYRYL